MGGGDIKFALFMGLVLGFPNIIVSLLPGILDRQQPILYHTNYMEEEKLSERDTIPFGPFLALATLLTSFSGNFLVEKTQFLLGV